jgi:prepilin-type N-terminal cleavage/methylation domain-containing protein
MIRQSTARASRRGFTLIELLTVIAIIAILVALLFPVFGMVRNHMRKNTCMSNMKDIIRGLKIYYDDVGTYPEGLYGVSINGGPMEDRLAGFKVDNRERFTCPNAHPSFTGNMTPVVPTNRTTGTPAADHRGRTLAFPQRSTYDFQRIPNLPAGTAELRYALKWTPASMGGAADEPRQLYRKEPPNDTVVTWCLYHDAVNPAGAPNPGGLAVVGFLGGQVENIPVQKMLNWAGPMGQYPWQVRK